MKEAVGLQQSHAASSYAFMQPQMEDESASDGGHSYDGTIEESGQNVGKCCTQKFNIIHIRLPKCASSSVSGILRGYAARHNLSGVDHEDWICKNKSGGAYLPTLEEPTSPNWRCDEPGLYSNHFRQYNPTRDGIYAGHKFKISQAMHQLTLPSILVTFLREPRGRQKSKYYFVVKCSHNASMSLKSFKKAADGNYQYEYIRESRHETVSEIMKRFTFIGLVERFDESVVQLFSMLYAPFEDAASLKSKDVSKIHGELPPFPQELEDYLNGPEFFRGHVVDIALYRAADTKLTKLMQGNRDPSFQCGHTGSVAPAEKKRAVRVLQKQNAFAEEKCGKFQDQKEDCYFHDFGCGIKCMATQTNFSNDCSLWAP